MRTTKPKKEKRTLPLVNERKRVVYSATLPNPVGLNSTYRTRRASSRIYKSATAVSWTDTSIDIMEKMGWKGQPQVGLYHLTILYRLETQSMDIDAPEKLLLDTVAQALGINDRLIGIQKAVKSFTGKRGEHNLEVVVLVEPIDNKVEFNKKSELVWRKEVKDLLAKAKN